jgi:hypothetical protein
MLLRRDKEARQKRLLVPVCQATERAVIHREILINHFKDSKTACREKCCKCRSTSEIPWQGEAEGSHNVFVGDFDKYITRHSMQDFYMYECYQ